MKYVLAVITLALTACGGGGGGGGSKPFYPVGNDTELRDYANGERITYSFSVEGQEYPSDPGPTYSGNGELERTIQLDAVSCDDGSGLTFDSIDIVDVISANGQEQLSRSTHILDDGIYLVSDTEGYSALCEDAETGALPEQLPQTLFVGRSWEYQITFGASSPEAEYDLKTYTGDYFISDVEEVSVPAGKFEAYKVVYEERFDYSNAGVGGSFPEVHTENGTLWIHPDVGPVKAVVNYVERDGLNAIADRGQITIEAKTISFEDSLTSQ